MKPGPPKNFDEDAALETARDVFWNRGYDGTAIATLESELNIGRKSLYDTFGNKRSLFLKALDHYTNSVINRICDGLEDKRSTPIANLERVLHQLRKHHAADDSRGCFLGVAMAQAHTDDLELAERLTTYLKRLEDAFESNVAAAQLDGTIDPTQPARDIARNLVALTQGMALMGRVADNTTLPRSMVDALIQNIRA